MAVRSPSSPAIPKSKKVVGGLLGRTSLGLLTVERFFLPEHLRRDRLGSRILVDGGERRAAARLHPRGVVDSSTFRRRAST